MINEIMIAKPPRPLLNVSASFTHKIPTIMEVTGSNKHMKLALVLPNNSTPFVVKQLLKRMRIKQALIIGHRQSHPF